MGGDEVPDVVRLGEAMEQKQRWSGATFDTEYLHVLLHRDLEFCEAFEHGEMRCSSCRVVGL